MRDFGARPAMRATEAAAAENRLDPPLESGQEYSLAAARALVGRARSVPFDFLAISRDLFELARQGTPRHWGERPFFTSSRCQVTQSPLTGTSDKTHRFPHGLAILDRKRRLGANLPPRHGLAPFGCQFAI